MGRKDDKDNSSIKSYIDQLDKLIDEKRKENHSIKAIVDAMMKDQEKKNDSKNDLSDKD